MDGYSAFKPGHLAWALLIGLGVGLCHWRLLVSRRPGCRGPGGCEGRGQFGEAPGRASTPTGSAGTEGRLDGGSPARFRKK